MEGLARPDLLLRVPVVELWTSGARTQWNLYTSNPGVLSTCKKCMSNDLEKEGEGIRGECCIFYDN
jgi:hypothetical protein